MNCPHPERPNVISLPSIGNPHCCCECMTARLAGLTPYKGKREAWDHAAYDYRMAGDSLRVRTTAGWESFDNEQPKGLFK